jgi:hypothetical protein
VSFDNVGGDGDWTAKVKLKAPKIKPGKFDLRDAKLGNTLAADNVLFGRIVGPDGGALTVQTDFGSPIDGSSVVVPAGSLGAPLVVTIAAAGSLTGTTGHSSGPAVDFGPSGTVFDDDPAPTDHSKQARLTIPFDPAAFPGGDTTTLVVYVRHANGVLEAVPGPYDFTASSVSFYTSSFSTYQATTTNPRPFRGSFVAVGVDQDLQSGFGGTFGFGLHEVSSTDGVTANAFFQDSKVQWFDGGSESGPVSTLLQNFRFGSMDVRVIDDGRITLMDTSTEETVALERGPSDDVFIARGRPLVVFRAAPGEATTSALLGTWHLFEEEFAARPGGRATPDLDLEMTSMTADVTFSADGKVSLSPSRRSQSVSAYPRGTWASDTRLKPAETAATFRVVEGQIVIEPSDGPSMYLRPVMGGDVLVGVTAGDSSSSATPRVQLTIFVRAAATTKAAFAGDWQFTASDVQVVDRDPSQEPPLAQGLRFGSEDVLAKITSAGGVTVSGSYQRLNHDDQGFVFVSSGAIEDDGQTITFRSDGSFAGMKDQVGALARGGRFLIHSAFGDGVFDLAFGIPPGPGPIVDPPGKR